MTTHKLNYYTPMTVGFDYLFNEVENVIKNNKAYPPHNILKEGDDKYKIELAVAGFDRSQLEIEVQNGVLKITGSSTATDEKEYLHKGISTREFSRRFTLSEYIEVKDAKLENGILAIYLERNLPESKKAKVLEIK